MKDGSVSRPDVNKPQATLQKILAEMGWEPQPEPAVAGFYVDFGLPHIPVSEAFAAISAEPEQFVFYINFGPAVPPDRRDQMAQFIARANWGLTIGNFEMDYEDGHVRFKSSIDFQGIELSEALIRNTILAAMNAVETYADLLIEVIAGKDPKQAVEEARSKPN